MDHFGHVDEALKAVADARRIIRKNTSRQVQNCEERDHMRTVVSVWFQSIRPKILVYVSDGELDDIDTALRKVWDATAKAAARTTYSKALDNARKGLQQLRKSMPVAPVEAVVPKSDETPPDFSPLATQPEMQAIMTSRWGECACCLGAGANLAAVVMMGGLIESLFMSKANHLDDKSSLSRAKRAPKDRKTGKAIPFQKWMLNDYIEVGHELGWIGDIAKSVSVVLRDYRNYIHPQAEYTKGHTVTEQDARLLWDVTKALVRELLNQRSS